MEVLGVYETVEMVIQLLSAKDSYTADHSRRVGEYAKELGVQMGLSHDVCEALYLGGLLHDVGKISIPDSILKKKGFLTADEFRCMQTHAELGYQFVNQWGILQPFARMVRDHHLRPDGQGYPITAIGDQYKKWADVDLMTRIVSVADVFDVLWSGRSYAVQKSLSGIVGEFQAHVDKQFDGQVVEALVVWLEHRYGKGVIYADEVEEKKAA